jgi:hypothetical protein
MQVEGDVMKNIADWTEADEAAHSKEVALANYQFQIEQGESMGIVQMYEDAALNAGDSHAEINAARERGKTWRLDD